MMKPINDFVQAAAKRGECIKRTAGGYQIIDAKGNVIDGDQWPLDLEDLYDRYGDVVIESTFKNTNGGK